MGQASRTQPRHSCGSLAAQLPCDHQATSSLRHASTLSTSQRGAANVSAPPRPAPDGVRPARVSGRVEELRAGS
jgi:hypothetical protein